ncbi:MAG: tyrosine recombinase XerC [Clostridia bacterium]|nr:tyrosine recombinase XerC [Clostridia bacterium]
MADFSAYPQSAQYYFNYLITVNGKSELTVSGYALDLRMFFRFLKLHRNIVSKNTDFDDIRIDDIDIDFLKKVTVNEAYAFLAYCTTVRKNNATSRARKVVAIKRFYRFLALNKQFIDENPLADLESPRIKKSLPKYLTLDQSLDLLSCVDGNFRERDYCILTLFLNCGLRLSELVGLNLTDIRNDSTIRVLGKGNKERIIYLNNACTAALNRYLRVRPADGVADRDAVFISRNKRRISKRAVQDIVDKFLKKAGLDGQGYSVHKLRHTAATLMYQHGDVDVRLLKEILGHESLSTTEIYTHVVNSQLQKALDSNPLNDLSPSDDSI